MVCESLEAHRKRLAEGTELLQGVHLVIHDVPGVRNKLSKLLGKGVVPHTWGTKCVAGQPDGQMRCFCCLDKIICRKLTQRPSQAVPCMQSA